MQQAAVTPYLCWRLLDTHRQVWVHLLGSLLLSPESWCAQVCLCPQRDISCRCSPLPSPVWPLPMYLDSFLCWQKVCLVKPRVSTVVMYRCESWTLKKTERQRIDAFELWYWRRLLSVSSTERWANQSILKEISPEYSLERLMMKLKLQSFGYLMQWTDSLANILMLGKIEDRRRRGWQRVRWLDGIIDLMDMKLS